LPGLFFISCGCTGSFSLKSRLRLSSRRRLPAGTKNSSQTEFSIFFTSTSTGRATKSFLLKSAAGISKCILRVKFSGRRHFLRSAKRGAPNGRIQLERTNDRCHHAGWPRVLGFEDVA